MQILREEDLWIIALNRLQKFVLLERDAIIPEKNESRINWRIDFND